MTWRNLMTKNMVRTLQRYLGYLLASTLAVAVFAMFTAFVNNPAVQHGYLTQTARELLQFFRVVVALFAIFFVFYFHAVLIRARSKEFGLLLTLGVTPRQIGQMMFYESLLIGLMALIIGMGVGLSCLYVFLLAMEAILALPVALPFAVPAPTFTTTGVFFGLVFLVEAIWTALRVTRHAPRVLLLGARIRQQPPRASWLLVALGLLCIGVAYNLALQFSTSLLRTAIPIVSLTIVGTYLLFSQCAVMLLKRLRHLGIPGGRLLIVARLSYRMRDYARTLTLVTVLNAMVLTGLGAVFGGLQLAVLEQTVSDPFALQLSVNALHPGALTPTQVQAEIARRHFTLQTIITTPVVSGVAEAGGQSAPVSIMSVASFTRLQQAELQAHPELAPYRRSISPLNSPDQAYVYVPDAKQPPTYQQIQLTAPNVTGALHVVDQDNRAILNDWHGGNDIGPATFVIVVTNDLYTRLASDVAPAGHWLVYSYILPNWRQSASLVNALRRQTPTGQQSLLTDTVSAVSSFKQVLSVMLFGGFFVSCLFFLAAGATIYLKLLTQQEEDQRQFHALERIGLQRREAARLLSFEFALLFFLPVMLAILHSVVALLNLAALFHDVIALTIIMKAFAPICGLYILCFAVYCWLSQGAYLRRMRLIAA